MSEIRLLKLLPDQISNFWPEIKPAIQASLPPLAAGVDSPDRMNRILSAALAGELEIHVWFRMSEDRSVKILVVATTIIMKNFESDHRTMLIYSIYAFDRASISEWKQGFQMLRDYARSKDCKLFTAFTENNGVKKLWEDLGGEVSYSLLTMEV